MFRRILIANRGEIAIRIARAAQGLGIETLALHGQDDGRSLHVLAADRALALPGSGVAAYLDQEAVIAAALAGDCDAIHPGYGFLAENAGFARRCAEAGLAFIGPAPETLALFGDKLAARRLAEEAGVPVIEGTTRATGLSCASAFMAKLGPGVPVMVKAAAGGGGRGMRVVKDPADLAEAYARCASEAKSAFGDETLFIERFIPAARHIEIQILGDGTGAVSHLFERDCSLQRRHQKLVEIAPAPDLAPATRARLIDAALRLGRAAQYCTLGTVEFLVAPDGGDFWFIETNPRLQVEHTVTEAVTGVDLVAAQIRLAAGEGLAALGLDGVAPRGTAVQLRLNLEVIDAEGGARPAAGTIGIYEMPGGPGLRVDGAGYAGYPVNPGFDPLIAKLILHHPGDFAGAIQGLRRALRQTRIEGVASNLGFLDRLLAAPDIAAGRFDNRWVERHLAVLAVGGNARADNFFPAAVTEAAAAEGPAAPPGTAALIAPLSGRIVALEGEPGLPVAAGQAVAVLEAMKMEHVVKAPFAGILRQWGGAVGGTIAEGAPLAFLEPADVAGQAEEAVAAIDLDLIRADLAEVIARHAPGLDANRPAAVARRAKTGQRTARANVDDLLDPGSFIEYGALLLPAQRRRRGLDDLIENGPADGLITGLGTVNAAAAGPEKSRTMVLAYDYTVMAGTQGMMNHKKTDRVLHLAEEWRLPLVLFAEGGGGRPGDTDWVGVAGLDVPTFATFASLAGKVPLVGVVSGYSFAGNAALLGCTDLIVATRNASFGMAGPAMIEGGGLGSFRPEEIGPVAMQWANGNIDVLVEDEAAAVAATKRLLSYFQGPLAEFDAADQRLLRHVVPENRLRVYDMREAIRLIADLGSVLELRAGFGPGMITALIRIEGRPYGLIANDPRHLGGAIDASAAEKGARFLRLCENHRLPVVSLVDTPGFMVGPACEAEGMVRKAADLFIAGARLTVPVAAVVLRKGYGLGAQSMTAGSFHRPMFTIAWPSGEFGGMGLEGAVRLGYRRELEAETDPAAQKALFDRLVAQQYANGKGINMASFGEIDAVIDPAETRAWITRGLAAQGRM